MVADMNSCVELQIFSYVLLVLFLVSLYFNLRQRRVLKEHDRGESALIKKAYFDPETELPNRNNIDIVLNEQIVRALRHKKTFLVAAIKVTNYHDVKLRSKERAKELIIEAGDRLLDSIRNEDMLSRISENGFVIVFNEYLEEENSDILFSRINKAFEEKFQHEKGTMSIEIAIGKSKYPDDSINPQDLINEATRQALNSK